ncbi:MAG: hypothetical protein JXA94_06505 [Parachlamydiales bacterium]|nr:hypothetical protein [Parachlamydiales bacterium]
MAIRPYNPLNILADAAVELLDKEKPTLPGRNIKAIALQRIQANKEQERKARGLSARAKIVNTRRTPVLEDAKVDSVNCQTFYSWKEPLAKFSDPLSILIDRMVDKDSPKVSKKIFHDDFELFKQQLNNIFNFQERSQTEKNLKGDALRYIKARLDFKTMSHRQYLTSRKLLKIFEKAKILVQKRIQQYTKV